MVRAWSGLLSSLGSAPRRGSDLQQAVVQTTLQETFDAHLLMHGHCPLGT
jgi:hypothetical protein